MAIGRIVRNANGYERVALTDEELQEIVRDHREKSLRLYQECLGDAVRMVFGEHSLPGPREVQAASVIANALFDKQAVSVETAMENKLGEKVFYFKEYQNDLQAVQV